MGETLSIRRYRPPDRERVNRVMERALRDAGALFEDGPDDETPSLVEEYVDSGGEFLVGEVGSRVVATGAFRPVGGLVAEYLDEIPEDAVELKRMHVDPQHQRRGYGRRILTELRGRARERGHRTVLLNTTTLQTAALRFYETAGFEVVRREPVEAGGRSFEVVIYRTDLD